MSPSKPLDKVDRALEMRVIDWLQWSEFGADERLAELALELINKRKAFSAELLKEAEALREALRLHCYEGAPCIDETEFALKRFEKFKEGLK